MDTQETQIQPPVQPVVPLVEQQVPSSNNSKKPLFVIAVLTLLVLGGLTATLLVNQNMSYNSKAKEKAYPAQSMRKYPNVTVTPGPINNTDGLNKALEELDKANTNASDAIQSNIDKMEQ